MEEILVRFVRGVLLVVAVRVALARVILKDVRNAAVLIYSASHAVTASSNLVTKRHIILASLLLGA